LDRPGVEVPYVGELFPDLVTVDHQVPEVSTSGGTVDLWQVRGGPVIVDLTEEPPTVVGGEELVGDDITCEL
jgi:hypothetical protein